MKLEELKNLVETNTGDERINFDGLNKAINTSFDDVIEKKVDKALKGVDVDGYKATGVADFLKKYEFDNEDSFSAYVANTKAGETELTQKASRLEGEKKTLEAEIAKLQGSVGTLQSEKTYLERMDVVRSSKKANVNPDFADFLVTKIGGNLEDGEAFEDKLVEFMVDNPQYSGGTQPRRTIGGDPPSTPPADDFDTKMLESMWGGKPPTKK